MSGRSALSRVIRNRPIFLGLCILGIFAFFAVFAPVIAPCDPWKAGIPFLPPGPDHFLGTNDIGQDIFSELLYGARISILIGCLAAFVSVVVGTLVGVVSGYYRGFLDDLLMGVTDVVLLIPGLPFMIILAGYLGPEFWNIVLVIGLLWWTSTARVVRSRVLQVREMPFIEGAKAMGFCNGYIMVRHILPNTLDVTFAKFVLAVAGAMLTEAGLSFLGLGDPLQKSWGMMLSYAYSQGGFIRGCWWWYLPPGLCISLAVLGFMLIGFGMQKRDDHWERRL